MTLCKDDTHKLKNGSKFFWTILVQKRNRLIETSLELGKGHQNNKKMIVLFLHHIHVALSLFSTFKTLFNMIQRDFTSEV